MTLDILNDGGYRGYYLPQGFAFLTTQNHHISERANTFERYQYFSFINITTLGYGDIIPLTDKASALAIFEAVVGQIYMVVLVAWLVGMHVSRRST